MGLSGGLKLDNGVELMLCNPGGDCGGFSFVTEPTGSNLDLVTLPAGRGALFVGTAGTLPLFSSTEEVYD